MTTLEDKLNDPAIFFRSSRASVFPYETVENAAKLIDSVPLAESLEKWKKLDAEGKHAGGRRAALNFRALLIVMHLTMTEHTPFNAVEFANIFWRRLDDRSRTLLGVDHVRITGDTAKESTWWYKRVSRIETAMYDMLDPDRKPKQNMNVAERRYQREHVQDPETNALRFARLRMFETLMVEASLLALPDDVRAAIPGHVSVDRTKIRSVSRRGRPSWPKAKRATMPEPEALLMEEMADWYWHKPENRPNGDGDDRDATWGYAANIAVATQHDPKSPRTHPLIAVAYSLSKPADDDLPEATVALLASLRARGYPAGRVTGDKEYFALQEPGRLLLPVRALGYEPLTDYRPNEIGTAVGNIGGAIQVEGRLYCPAMPNHLIRATADADMKTKEGRKLARTLINDERPKFEVNIKERPDEDGNYKIMCPALGISPTVECPLRGLPHAKATTKITRPLVENPPAAHEQDRICCQNSVTVAPNEEKAFRYLQAVRYKTPEWYSLYGHDRSQIESYNAAIKDPAKEDIENTARRRRFGFSAASIAVGFAIISANLRMADTWYREVAELRATGTPKKRKTGKFTKLTIETYRPKLPQLLDDGTILFPSDLPAQGEDELDNEDYEIDLTEVA